MDELGKFALSFTLENKVDNLNKVRLLKFISNLTYTEWDIPLTSIWEFIKQSWILNTLGILCMPQNFWH